MPEPTKSDLLSEELKRRGIHPQHRGEIHINHLVSVPLAVKQMSNAELLAAYGESD